MKRSTSKSSSKKASSQKNTSSSAAHFDFEMVKQFTDFMKENDLTELDLRSGEKEIRLRRGDFSKVSMSPMAMPSFAQPSVVTPAPVASAAPSESSGKKNHMVTSPFVGTFYRSPGPNQDAFVEEGQTVSAGDTLCIIEAMKLMNEIESDIKGRIVRVLVSNGTPVEFGEALFEIEAQ